MQYFVGVDLAWSPRNTSGIAVLAGSARGVSLVGTALLRTDAEIVSFIATHVPLTAKCSIAIDAPLVVPNETGRRACEAELTRDFRQYHAGTHPSNRTRLGAWNGGVPRGEALVAALQTVGVAQAPSRSVQHPRRCYEVYPHPAMVVLFGLAQVLPYKSRPSRSSAVRWQAFVRYKQHLQSLATSDPHFQIPQSVFSRVPLRASALKAYEDTLDAVFCAYLAAWFERHPRDTMVYGSLAEGYIVTPSLPRNRSAC